MKDKNIVSRGPCIAPGIRQYLSILNYRSISKFATSIDGVGKVEAGNACGISEFTDAYTGIGNLCIVLSCIKSNITM